jgi:hypothetical protein
MESHLRQKINATFKAGLGSNARSANTIMFNRNSQVLVVPEIV